MDSVSVSDAMNTDVRVEVGGAELVLLPERAVWWAAERALLVSDLHWGKVDTLRAAGAPVPGGLCEGELTEQLGRLDAMMARTNAERVIVLGDLVHHETGITEPVAEQVEHWRRAHKGASFELVPGNHDRAIDVAAERWGLRIHPAQLSLGGLTLVHDAAHAGDDAHAIAGHEHPAVVLRGGGDELKLACFVVGARRTLLPAFSVFTAGGPWIRSRGDRVFAVADASVVPLPG